MKNKISTLVLGGARSGKSRYAEKLASDAKLNLVYIATAEIRDKEMIARVKRHQADRKDQWKTIEEPIDIASEINKNSTSENVILIDCLTLWLSNLLEKERSISNETKSLINAIKKAKGHLIFVSNEVGQGIVPANPLARTFRDEAGRLNQSIAETVDEVFFITAGLPMTLKTKIKNNHDNY